MDLQKTLINKFEICFQLPNCQTYVINSALKTIINEQWHEIDLPDSLNMNNTSLTHVNRHEAQIFEQINDTE